MVVYPGGEDGTGPWTVLAVDRVSGCYAATQDRPKTEPVRRKTGHALTGTSQEGHWAMVADVPDPIFAHPRLARVYDVFDGERVDLDLYVDLVRERRARQVLDVGCGTGSLPVLLARCGITVIAVDPASASLDVARDKDGADMVTWVHGDATTLPPLQVDVAVMTGNVAQVFLTDDEWSKTLRGVRGALAASGRLVFETRRPDRRAWEEWALDTGPVVRDVPGVGQVEQRFVVTEIAPPYVSFRYSYRFARDGVTVTSDSTLRFRSREEIEVSLVAAGFTTIEVRDAPDRPGRQYVFIAALAP